MLRYLVDFLFLPDRSVGAQVIVHAPDADTAVTAATRSLAAEIGATWAFDLVTVQEA